MLMALQLSNAFLLVTSIVFLYSLLCRLYYVLFFRRHLLRYPALTPLCIWTNLGYILHNAQLQATTRTEYLHQRHLKDPIIRLGPNRLSFSSPHAIKDIYGTSTACSKGDQYSTPGGSPNLLSVVDRKLHSIKRKRMSAAFTTSHLLDWQDKVVDKLQDFLIALDEKCGSSNDTIDDTWIDLRFWSHLFTLDTIMDIALSHISTFVKHASDHITLESERGTSQYLSLRDCLFAGNRSVGPIVWSKDAFPWLKTLRMLYHPTQRQIYLALQWPKIVRSLVLDRVAKYHRGERLDDLFECLMQDKAGRELSLSENELVAETSHFIDAGSDTTSITLTYTLYCLIKNPEKLAKLKDEVESAFETGTIIPRYERIRTLPYLKACLDESMRLRPALSAGMQRETPAQGTLIAGEWIPGNVFVSVPAYVAHRDASIFPDPDSFVPERWLVEDGRLLQNYNLSFSAGGRVCIGRNIAYIELSMAIASLVKRYDFELLSPDWRMSWEEHFNMWPKNLPVRLRFRT